MSDATQLSLLSEDELTRLEKKIREGLKAFVEVGNALLRIQQNNGFRLRGYKTFEAYCEKEFGFTDRHGRRLIDAAKTAGSVHKAIGQAPANEAVARELKHVADDPIVLQKVQSKLQAKKTDIAHAPAETVAQVVATVTGKTKAEPKPAPKASGNGAHKPKLATAGDDAVGQLLHHLGVLNTELGTLFARMYETSRPAKYNKILTSLDTAIVIAKQLQPGPATAKTKACKNCGEFLPAGDVTYCENCGAIVK